MRNKIIPFSEFEDNLSPWHHHNEPDLFSTHPLRRHSPYNQTLQNRNHSQPIFRMHSDGRQYTPAKVTPLLGTTRVNRQACENEPKKMKKKRHLFTKTMNITFKSSQGHQQCWLAEGEKESESCPSQRSICSSPTNFRIHSNHPSAGTLTDELKKVATPSDRKDTISKQFVVTSYTNFFASSIKRNKTARNLDSHDERLQDILKVLRNNVKNNDKRGKVMRKVERNGLRNYLEGTRCLY